MTEAEWLTCTDPQKMLESLRGKASERKLRLFASACCRRVWDLLPDEPSRDLIVLAERHADGLANEQDLSAGRQAYQEYQDAATEGDDILIYGNTYAGYAASELVESGPGIFCASFASTKAASAKAFVGCEQQERVAQSLLLHDIFNSPFRPSPPPPPAILAWNDHTIPRLAQAIYQVRKMPEGTLDTGRLAILADALIDAGCEDEALIQHCRSEGPHVRGCWAIDLILGKA